MVQILCWYAERDVEQRAPSFRLNLVDANGDLLRSEPRSEK